MKKYVQFLGVICLVTFFAATYTACKKESNENEEEKSTNNVGREISVLDPTGKYSFTFQIKSDCEELLNSIDDKSILVSLTNSDSQIGLSEEEPHSEPPQTIVSQKGFVSFSVIRVNTNDKQIPAYRVNLSAKFAELIASKDLSIMLIFDKYQLQPLAGVSERAIVPITQWLWWNNKRVKIYKNGVGLVGVQTFWANTGSSSTYFHHYHEWFDNAITCTVCSDRPSKWIRRANVFKQSQYGMVTGWEGIANGC